LFSRMILISLITSALIFLGCASKKPSAETGENSEAESGIYAEEGGYGGTPSAGQAYSDDLMAKDAPARPMAAMSMPMAKSAARASRSVRSGGNRAMQYSAPPPSSPQPVAVARMVAHEGNIQLRSPEPEKVLDSAVTLARAFGGYLETRRQGWAALKVPAAMFDSAFQVFLTLADVLGHSRSAQDITAEFRDTELRQKVVGATIARLEALIEKARNDLQKMRLLGELKRYREEWEIIEAQKKALKKRAEFAAIMIQVQGYAPATAGGSEADFPVFGWIRRLNPFNPDLQHGLKLRFSNPEGLVETPENKMWRVTAAEGTEMWARTLVSPLFGESRFWRDAIWQRLRGQFKTADSSEIGGFQFCRFAAHGPRVYSYWVGVRTDVKGRISVVELYFPDEKLEKIHSEAMLAVVKQGPK